MDTHLEAEDTQGHHHVNSCNGRGRDFERQTHRFERRCTQMRGLSSRVKENAWQRLQNQHDMQAKRHQISFTISEANHAKQPLPRKQRRIRRSCIQSGH